MHFQNTPSASSNRGLRLNQPRIFKYYPAKKVLAIDRGPNCAQSQHCVNQTFGRPKSRKLSLIGRAKKTVEKVIEAMNAAGVPVGWVMNMRDIVEKHNQAHRAIQDVLVDGKDGEGWNVEIPGTFPRIEGFEFTPSWAGPALGDHTDVVLEEMLGLGKEDVENLRGDGIIS
ncbi:uncharacterized protein EV420DRAFT_1485866 [Desarmillaria tabescens]|uniref:CoA-transferase family III n=1 Tax=Armillaria tabescens TaxID=1929756 RepID=A0AA39MNC1_ARMTA|nr:uncharacterized protein EV420DRAFT_1485866 [Desarmillaria tabescens]KAK0440657.1 hypothetical protein EV420DRAFT_1485866 [Desarmillaria tabescens]